VGNGAAPPLRLTDSHSKGRVADAAAAERIFGCDWRYVADVHADAADDARMRAGP